MAGPPGRSHAISDASARVHRNPQGEGTVSFATDVSPPGAAAWVVMPSCFRVHFMSVLEKQEKYVRHQQFLAIIQLIGTRKQAENCAYQRAQWSSAATDLGGPAAIYSRGRCNSRHEERLPSL